MPLRACRAIQCGAGWVASSEPEPDRLPASAMHLGLIGIVISEYDPAIRFFVDGLGFELVEDSRP